MTASLDLAKAANANHCIVRNGNRPKPHQRLLRSFKKLFVLNKQLPALSTMGETQTTGSSSKPQVYVVGSPNPKSPFLRIAHVSDTCDVSDSGMSATYHADVLVHSGNLCSYQFRKHFFKATEFHNQIKAINEYFARMPHRYKIFVPGPNEIFFDAETRERLQALMPDCIYLQDSGCEIDGVTFYGLPWSASRRGNVGRGFGKSLAELRTVWSNVPDGVDVLISHSVPTGSLYDDMVTRIRPKMFLYGSRQQRSSRSDLPEDNGVKFKDNVIFSNGHAGNCCRRGVFDFYADSLAERRTCIPSVAPETVVSAYQHAGTSPVKCTLS